MYKKSVIVVLVFAFIFSAIYALPTSSYAEDKTKAYKNIYFGITTIEYAQAILEDEDIHPNSVEEAGEDKESWIGSDWDWFDVYVGSDAWVYLGDTKYELIAQFYGDKTHPSYNFKLGELGKLLFHGPLESYFNIDKVIEEREYLVDVITKRYGTPSEVKEIKPIEIGKWQTEFTHSWYSEEVNQNKRIKIGIQCTENFYFATMSIEDPDLVAKKSEDGGNKKENIESEAEDF
ncbi:hypothetical protein KGY79_09845 [Candidatus Bipolaricaulota bacterium]|nr:hypothetical protein [Candidatus Bipolaricaulota bacterium]